jgi:hypothetical protein
MAVSVDKPIPDFPTEISPQQIDAWRDALGIDKQETSAWIGKAPSWWSKFLAGEKDIKLKQLNSLLRLFAIRAEALRHS